MTFNKDKRIQHSNSVWRQTLQAISDLETGSSPPLPRNKITGVRDLLLRIIKISAAVLGLLLLLAGGGSFYWLHELGIFNDQSERLSLIQNWKVADNSVVFDRSGQPVAELFDKYSRKVFLADVPPFLINSIIAVEDRKFWQHTGIDPLAMARVVYHFVLHHGEFSQGGSTITQQLVRTFLLTRDKTIARKVQEIALAVQLEKVMSKEQILELYVNVLYLGNGAFGVGAAAERYFGKPLAELEPQELALIAGLFQSPSGYDPTKYPQKAKKRQLHVIKSLVSIGFLDAKEGEKLTKAPLKYKQYQSKYGTIAPYYIDYVIEMAGKILDLAPELIKGQGYRIYTELDVAIQSKLESAIKNSEANFRELEQKLSSRFDGRSSSAPSRRSAEKEEMPGRIEVAAVVIDHAASEIVGMVGGRNYQVSQFNRATNAKRSPGSAFKPILYSLALQRGFKWSDLVYVSPISLGDYRPKSTESDYLTVTTLLRSFYRSMNAPAVELASKVGTQSILDHGKKMGIETPLQDEYGVVLGGSASTVMDMARVYSVFAQDGVRENLAAISRIEDRSGKVVFEKEKDRLVQSEKDLGQSKSSRESDQNFASPRRVLDPKVNFLMKEGLRSVFKFGTGHAYSEFGQFAAGKTGTSNNSKDNWFCGFDAKYVVIVWVGSDNFIPVDGGENGATLALPVWTEIMSQIGISKNAKFWLPPEGVVSRTVHPEYGTLSETGIQMWFLENNLPSEKSNGLEFVKKSSGFRGIFNR